MSDHIPFEIQSEIMKRLPVKPLLQFRTVSKQWKSHIDSFEFIGNYHVRKTQPQDHLFIRYTNNHSAEKCVLLADYDTFPPDMFHLTVPVSVQGLEKPTIFASLGLLCFYSGGSGYKKAVIWNPAIRKSVSVVVSNDLDSSYETVVGFGVCPSTCDPKLVKVAFKRGSGGSETIFEVFSLGVGAWRRLGGNLPRKSITFTLKSVAIDRFIYWYAEEWIGNFDGRSHWLHLIVSFDMVSEEFMEIRLPDCFAFDIESHLFVCERRESLVVLQDTVEGGKEVYNVWEMEEHGGLKSFKKLFTISQMVKRVLGFTKCGKAILEMGLDYEDVVLFVYEPNSQNLTFIDISGKQYSIFVSSYMETLLLLNH